MPRWAWGTAAIVVVWAAVRLAASWHSAIVADCVDMFRTLGGLVRLATTNADVMTASMGIKEGVGDIEVVGVNAVQLFYEGLPFLRLFSHTPCMWWMQVFNAIWIGLAGGLVAVLCRTLIGGRAAPVATAAFLFSPYMLTVQILPVPTVCIPLAVLLVLLPLRFYSSGSALALVFLGGLTGFTATLPSVTPMTGLAILVVAWRIWSGPRVSRLALATAILLFVSFSTPNIPTWTALREAYKWYVLKSWPMSVGVETLQGQISPSAMTWTKVDPPGTPLLLAATLVSPFATPRNSLRNWGDVVFEPLSAALCAIGLVLCLRQLFRSRGSLYLMAFLAAGFIPGFVSSYDRPSLTRIYGVTVPLAVLAAIGLLGLLAAARRLRWRVTMTTAVAIGASGLLIFDVVNPRILSQSTWGLLMRSVDVAWLDRVAMLTAEGRALNQNNVADNAQLWEADWLRHYHPYISELARCAPRHPVPIIAIQKPEELQAYDLLFWNPALDQTIQITRRDICRLWPDAILYTIVDRAGLSRVYAAQIHGSDWRPSLPQKQWSTRSCGEAGAGVGVSRCAALRRSGLCEIFPAWVSRAAERSPTKRRSTSRARLRRGCAPPADSGGALSSCFAPRCPKRRH